WPIHWLDAAPGSALSPDPWRTHRCHLAAGQDDQFPGASVVTRDRQRVWMNRCHAPGEAARAGV
ncbi:MAG TPA: hypothetical protein VMT88_03460, partial [Actinomycetes bacterium]|nr:hypothetical protein [Actinomycetes bacterium]